MNKKDIRAIYLAKREAMSELDYLKSQDLLLIRFQALPLPFLHTVHTYLPMDGRKEPDPDAIIRWLSFRNPGLRLAIPRSDFGTCTMTHWTYDEDTVLMLTDKGIPEPSNGRPVAVQEIDMVIVPLLAYDGSGHRVGFGKGFYDRFLAECRPDAIRIGLSFFGPVDRISDTGTFDERLHYCVTPERIYEF